MNDFYFYQQTKRQGPINFNSSRLAIDPKDDGASSAEVTLDENTLTVTGIKPDLALWPRF